LGILVSRKVRKEKSNAKNLKNIAENLNINYQILRKQNENN